jgi:hypothetical protein
MNPLPFVMARVEYELPHLENWNLLGVLVLVVLLVALVGAIVGHVSAPHEEDRKVKVPSLSHLPTDEAAAEQLEQQKLEAQRLPSLTVPKSKREKRRWLRRGGNPVEILMVTPAAADPKPSQVLDRSRGGLLIATAHAVDKGTIIKVRACHAPEDLDWIPLEVRHCRQKDDHWLLGCAFRQEHPWSVLLLFG